MRCLYCIGIRILSQHIISMEKIAKIVDKSNAGFDADYWIKKSAEERIAGLEKMRNQVLTKNGIRQRFQRVCRVIKR